MHGIDSITPGALERLNREALTKLAYEMNIRFALPRAPQTCANDSGSLCWAYSTPSIAWANYKYAYDNSKDKCFGGSLDQFGVIAFSNGGFHMNKLMQFCLPHQAQWILSIGSAGSASSYEVSDFSRCGKLTLLVGTQDSWTYPRTLEYYKYIKSKNSNVSLKTYDGPHEVSYDAVKSFLKSRKGRIKTGTFSSSH